MGIQNATVRVKCYGNWAGLNGRGCCLSQKLMGDLNHSRKARQVGVFGANLNMLIPLSAARLIWELFDAELALWPQIRTQSLMRRNPHSPDAVFLDYHLSKYLGANLPAGFQI